MKNKDDIKIKNKIIHRITNVYTSELESLDSSTVDEFYSEDNKLHQSITYNKDRVVTSERTLFFYSDFFEVYKTRDLEGAEEVVSFDEVKWNEDKSVITTKLFDKDKIEESEDICIYSNERLIEQTMIADGDEIIIKHFHDTNGDVALSEEFRNGKKRVIIKYIKEGNGIKATWTDSEGKLINSQYEEKDQLGRVILLIDYNERNQKVGEAEFAYDKFGEKILETFSGDTKNSYIKRFYSFGKPEEMTYVENIYKYIDEEEWIIGKEVMEFETIGKTVNN